MVTVWMWLKRMRRQRKFLNLPPDYGVVVIGSNASGQQVWYAAMDEEAAMKGFDSLGGVQVNQVRHGHGN